VHLGVNPQLIQRVGLRYQGRGGGGVIQKAIIICNNLGQPQVLQTDLPEQLLLVGVKLIKDLVVYCQGVVYQGL
jgi:hypothetical protein